MAVREVREGASQKGTFSTQSGIGRTFQREERVWTQEERIKSVLSLGRMVHCGTPNEPLPSPLSRDKVQNGQGFGPGSLTLSPQPAAPHQGHFFKRTFQGGVRRNLSEDPQDTQASPTAPGQLPREKPPALPSLVLPGEATEETFKGALVNKQGQACRSPLPSLLQKDNGSTVLVGSAGQPPIVRGWGAVRSLDSNLSSITFAVSLLPGFCF